VESPSLKELETRVEALRRELHQKIGDDITNLSSASLLLLSKELDALILEYMKAKQKHGE
jgi:capsule polysaccharide export protein KpsE/RkpR